MTLVNPKPLGWAFGELFTSAQANSFGTQIIRALDGTGGGSYALAAPLSVTGALVTFEDVTVTDDLTVTDGLTVGGTLTANAAVTINGDVSFNGNYTTIGNAGADVLTVTAGATFNAGAAFNANVALGNAPADIITLLGVLGYSGGGRALVAYENVNTALSSVDITQKRFLILSSALVGTTTTTLTGTLVDGDWFVVQNNDAAVQNLDGLLSTGITAGTGQMYIYNGSTWYLAMSWS